MECKAWFSQTFTRCESDIYINVPRVYATQICPRWPTSSELRPYAVAPINAMQRVQGCILGR